MKLQYILPVLRQHVKKQPWINQEQNETNASQITKSPNRLRNSNEQTGWKPLPPLCCIRIRNSNRRNTSGQLCHLKHFNSGTLLSSRERWRLKYPAMVYRFSVLPCWIHGVNQDTNMPVSCLLVLRQHPWLARQRSAIYNTPWMSYSAVFNFETSNLCELAFFCNFRVYLIVYLWSSLQAFCCFSPCPQQTLNWAETRCAFIRM